jgi:heme-degrading monooxygenase HmoA
MRADRMGGAAMRRDIPKTAVARVWHGRTTESIADEYERYLYEEGVRKLRATKGNLGVQVFRQAHDGIVEFTTISYWDSRDAIQAYAGRDIAKTHHLPRDSEYLLELEPTVKHFDVLVNEWGSND